MSRIDYCNSVLAGLPQSTIAPLQRVQNTTARLVFELGTREHVTASLLQLQWLPVHWRVQFKLCCLMHSIFHERCPDYLSNIVRPVDLSRSRAGLRSSLTTNFSYGQNVESAPFLTLALPLGTFYCRTCVLFLSLCFLGSD